MQDDLDLDAYFARIGYAGRRAARLETLREIHRLHPQAIAFENLNPLLRGRAARRAIVAGQDRDAATRRLLLRAQPAAQARARHIGFRVAGLAARVLWNQPEDAIRPRTHMLLQVDIDDEMWIADVGFGGLTLTAPLRLVEHTPQATPHEPFRLTRLAGDYALQAEVRGAWRTLYRFDLQEQVLPDYELTSWYLSNNPESHFVQKLIAARTAPQRRYALRGNELTVHELNGESVQRSSRAPPSCAKYCARRLG